MSANRFDVTNTLKRIETLLQSARRAAQGAMAIGNWAQVLGIASGTYSTVHAQTGPVTTNVAALSLVPKATGIFLVGVKASFSYNTTNQTVGHTVYSKQGTTAAGALAGAGFLSQVKTGVFAPTAKGGILNADAAGGGGITFEGSAAFTILHTSDVAATLTGLLTANGVGSQNFEFGFAMIDAAGPTAAAKTPFTLGLAACVVLEVNATNVVTYDTMHLFACEMPFG